MARPSSVGESGNGLARYTGTESLSQAGKVGEGQRFYSVLVLASVYPWNLGLQPLGTGMNKIWEAINTGNLQMLSQELGQVTKELREDNDKAEKTYTDTERLAAYEVLLAKIQTMLYPLRSERDEQIWNMIDEEMDK